MKCMVLSAFALIVLSGCRAGEGETDIEKLIRRLHDDDFYARRDAEGHIVKYFNEHPSERWALGNRLEKRREAIEDAMSKLCSILKEISTIPALSGGDPRQVQYSLLPSYCDTHAHIGEGKHPIMIVLVASKPMFGFYRRIGQRTHNQRIPDFDFERRMLLAVSVTSFGNEGAGFGEQILITDWSAKRDFIRRESLCKIKINKATYGSVCFTLEISRGDLPMEITLTPKGEAPVNLAKLKDEPVSWDKWEWLSGGCNILALRKLAEACDDKVPAKHRRAFLERNYMLDPLLPYVMLTCMAAKYPEAFREDCEYWEGRFKDKFLDGSAIVGPLFEGALEEGKRIIALKAAPGTDVGKE